MKKHITLIVIFCTINLFSHARKNATCKAKATAGLKSCQRQIYIGNFALALLSMTKQWQTSWDGDRPAPYYHGAHIFRSDKSANPNPNPGDFTMCVGSMRSNLPVQIKTRSSFLLHSVCLASWTLLALLPLRLEVELHLYSTSSLNWTASDWAYSQSNSVALGVVKQITGVAHATPGHSLDKSLSLLQLYL